MKIRNSNEFGPLNQEALTAFEEKHSFRSPEDYRRFLLDHNGGKPDPKTVDFVQDGAANSSDVQYIYGIHDGEYWASLEWHLDTYNGRIVDKGLPVAGDSGGNQYVLIVRGKTTGQVYFWDHELETDPPGYDNMSYVAASFTEFCEKLYEYIDPDETEEERIIRENDLEALKTLLDSGYDIETLDEYDRTMIENAAIRNRVDIIKMLFDEGANLRNALQRARQNYHFFPEHKASVDLLVRLSNLRSPEDNPSTG